MTARTAEAAANNFTSSMDRVAQAFEALGAVILVIGVVCSLALALIAARRYGWSERAYLVLRQAFGGTLLLGRKSWLPPICSARSPSRRPWRTSWCSG